MPGYASNIDTSSNEWRKKWVSWCLVALLLIAAAFFLGNWVENRMDAALRQHDALLAAALEQAAPEALPSVLTALEENDPALLERGYVLLEESQYTPPEQRTGARTIFTVFMLVVMLLRGAKLVFGTRRMFKRARSASKNAAFHLLSFIRPAAPSAAEQVPLRQALQELSSLISQPLQSARTLTEVILEKGVEEQTYTDFCLKLQTQLDKTESLLSLISRLTSLKDEMDSTLDIQRYPLFSIIQATETLAAPALSARGLSYRFSKAPPVCLQTDLIYLPQALSHLMLSCAGSRQAGSIVQVSLTPHGATLFIDISCQGQRIHIKNRLLRLAAEKWQPSSLDLAIADTILQSLGASLEDLSTPHGACAYRVRLPLFPL